MPKTLLIFKQHPSSTSLLSLTSYTSTKIKVSTKNVTPTLINPPLPHIIVLKFKGFLSSNRSILTISISKKRMTRTREVIEGLIELKKKTYQKEGLSEFKYSLKYFINS